jgi:carbon-monoxide dehydrogenase medium subunit
MVGVFVAETAGGVRVAVTGAGACVFRVAAFEAALTKRFAPESLEGLGVPADGLNQDLHGSAEYRANLVSVIAKRAVAAALAG